MRITFLGSGSAFTEENWQSNILIEQNGKKLVIDFGSFAPLSLKEAGYAVTDVDAVYISHLHADHIGGLEALGFKTYFNPDADKPKLFCQGKYDIDADSHNIHSSGLVHDLWENSLSGGMRGLEGQIASLDTYFDVNAVSENGHFIWEGIQFDIIQTIHVSARYRVEKSFGLMWNDPDTGERVYLTTDTQFCPLNAQMAYIKEADIVMHDCSTEPFKSLVHANYGHSELEALPLEIKAKMWLYHYSDDVLLNWETWNERALSDGFLGFVKTGAIFDRSYTSPSVGFIGKKAFRLPSEHELIDMVDTITDCDSALSHDERVDSLLEFVKRYK